MRLILFGYLLVLLSFSRAQDLSCNSTTRVQPNQVYYLNNPGFPQNYTPGTECTWTATCPQGYNCQLDCSEVKLPQAPSCSMDRLLISRIGDPSLTAAENYCGRVNVTVTSIGQRLTVGLFSEYESPGGRFNCQLTAVAVFNSSSCRCGYKKSNRIVGGQETGVNEFPMMAGIVDIAARRIKCGAVIISKRLVMTAAHCVMESLSNLAVVIGEHDVTTRDETGATQLLRILSVSSHPFYTASNNDYDISILRLEQNIVFSDRVGPVCLPFRFINSDFTGNNVTILGWGTTSTDGPASPVLQKVDVNVISQPACRRSVPAVTPRQICTFTPGKNTCQFDTGGPLLYMDPSNGLLYSVGIVSSDKLCASDLPTINTRVTKLLDWIVADSGDIFCRL